MLEAFRYTSKPDRCAYLPAATRQMSYRFIGDIEAGEYEQMLARGWRHFGIEFFRPNCPQCAQCRSLRVKVADFTPGKTQRRVLKKNEEVRLEVRPASVTAEHLRLYNEYHAFMALEKEWKTGAITHKEYEDYFLGGRFPFAYDFLYYLGGQLVAVGLVDLLPTAASSVYFYHDPSLRKRSLGILSMLKELEYAKARGIQRHYLGYWVPECDSMRYKSDFYPFELLVGYPAGDQEPIWVSEEEWRPALNREARGLIL